ncbi:MAG: Holliday junction branch migration protein RuvA [Elusimicrobiota bacterium]|jgi:Holliday junction DNA helicase RuvA|nr:Holliday junction branch migration protein RuvA [Elusimicrobiota bacterium]
MIAYLKGEVFEVSNNAIILLVGGVGYYVNMASPSLTTLEKGQQLEVYITESLSPYDGTALYGFLTKEDKELFLLFKESIPNTGPKKALEFLAKALRSVADFHRAIINKDPKILTTIFGFTAKTAQKLIDSLKDKMDTITVQGEVKIKTAEIPFMSDVMAALTALGYSAQESRRAIEKIYQQGANNNTVEENIKAALRILRK